MKKIGGLLVLTLALVLAPSCATMNYEQAAVEGGTGAVIGTVLGYAVGTTVGYPNGGARIGAAIGGTVGATHGLFNRDEEIVKGQQAVIAEEKKTQEALALSNQALAQVLENQRSGAVVPQVVVPTTKFPDATRALSPTKLKTKTPTTARKKPVSPTTVAPNAVMLCGCAEVEVYNAASFGIRVKAGQDLMGTFVPRQTPICLPQGPVSVKSETVPPSDWVVRDPGMAKRIIIQDSDFQK